MAEDSDLEKTEEPTGRRIEPAREQGQVPHSRELGTFLVLAVSAATIWMMGGWFAQRSMAIMQKGFTIESQVMRDPALMLPRLADLSGDALLAFSPLMAVILVAAILPPFFLNAWVFSPKALVPDLNRLNPLTGLGRMFSWNGLMELAKALLKAILVGGVAALLIWKERDELFGLLGEPLESGLAHAGHLVSYSFLIVVAALVLIVAADVPFQLWQYFDKRKMAAVPKANVVVTNPTHYAVALSYQAGMSAPKVVAKGVGAVALKIREIAGEHAVPILEAPPLARALYKHSEIDAEIPSALYNAVAEVLAYIYQLANWRQAGGVYPVPPRDLPVPPELIPEPL